MSALAEEGREVASTAYDVYLQSASAADPLQRERLLRTCAVEDFEILRAHVGFVCAVMV
jgi:hypothetical protein